MKNKINISDLATKASNLKSQEELNTIFESAKGLENEDDKSEVYVRLVFNSNFKDEAKLNEIFESAKNLENDIQCYLVGGPIKPALYRGLSQNPNFKNEDGINYILDDIKKNSRDTLFEVLENLAKNPSTTSGVLSRVFDKCTQSYKGASYEVLRICDALIKHKNTQISEEIHKFYEKTLFLYHITYFQDSHRQADRIYEVAKNTLNLDNKANILASFAGREFCTKERFNEIFEIAKSFEKEQHKSLVFRNFVGNTNAPAEIVEEIFEISKSFSQAHKQIILDKLKLDRNPNIDREKLKIYNPVYEKKEGLVQKTDQEKPPQVKKEELFHNDPKKEGITQEVLQKALFFAYNESVGKSNPLEAMKESLKDLNIQPEDIEKLFNAMKYVSGGKELTAENKETLKNDSVWIDLIEKICHYLKKFVTLGFGTTQKESRDNFNKTVGSHLDRLEAERNDPKLNNNRNI